jgi:excisionase family DNA binding protein
MNETISGFQREGLSVIEACAVAGIGRTKLYHAIRTGDLVAHKYGKRRIILRKSLFEFLNNLPTAGLAPGGTINHG